MLACGLCHSDLSVWQGHIPHDIQMVPGHEALGTQNHPACLPTMRADYSRQGGAATTPSYLISRFRLIHSV
jgi:hypothetical protein